MRRNRRFRNESGEAVITYVGVNASGIVSGNSGILWTNATDTSVFIEAKNSNDEVIFEFFDRKNACTGLRRDASTNQIQIQHDFGEVSDSATITITFHNAASVSSLQIFEDINESQWKINSIFDIRKMLNLTILRILYQVSMVPDLTRLESLQTLVVNGTDENGLDVRYSRSKSLTGLNFGPTWLNGVSNDMTIINQFLNLTTLSVYQNVFKSLSPTEDYLLDFTAESQLLNITSYGYTQIQGYNQNFPERLKHLIHLESFTVNEKSNSASYPIDLNWPLLDSNPNNNLRTLTIGGLFGTNCNIIAFPDIDMLPSLESIDFVYVTATTAGVTSTMDVFYIWFFLKVWNPASDHPLFNAAHPPETYIHANFRELYHQPRFIPPATWDRDKYQEISRVPGFFLSAPRILPDLISYTPSSGDWSNVLNSDVSLGNTITKTSGGNAHDTGGGFINILGQWNDLEIHITPFDDNSFIFIGFCDSTVTTIDRTLIKYGIYFRSGGNVQEWKFGSNPDAGDTFIGYQAYTWKLKRNNGRISIDYDNTEWRVFKNIDNTDIFDLSDLKIMVSIYSENTGFNSITQFN